MSDIEDALLMIQSGNTIRSLREENARLKADIAKNDCDDGATHNSNCYDYGRKHYDCALQRIRQLEAELAECKRDAERWRYWRAVCDAETAYSLTGNSEASDEELDSAIDAAMSKGGGG